MSVSLSDSIKEPRNVVTGCRCNRDSFAVCQSVSSRAGGKNQHSPGFFVTKEFVALIGQQSVFLVQNSLLPRSFSTANYPQQLRPPLWLSSILGEQLANLLGHYSRAEYRDAVSSVTRPEDPKSETGIDVPFGNWLRSLMETKLPIGAT